MSSEKLQMKDYDEWFNEQEDELWISYNESGAVYDMDFDDYCDYQFKQVFR